MANNGESVGADSAVVLGSQSQCDVGRAVIWGHPGESLSFEAYLWKVEIILLSAFNFPRLGEWWEPEKEDQRGLDDPG